ncbi:nucleolar and coiled-body phosphoprotein 1 [Curvularia kusanoi]|uniref:Nucleolar and coiled-body phosphoprotein 1 n=1 Tax=Curvularia kusanoi TaxID=90978 RepID=A0A9P4TFF7_CURKU|nr:nucleolar and coiled-body phosphoprotein 1 [Curvularia kusanoi]
MRLRLTIQRNGLPAANILWSVPDTNSATAYTITRLLEDINIIVPLEAEHWGLEHYVVEVGGFECLHFMPVGQCLKEDDHVSIRPLMRAEIRSRTLTGRHQISDGGLHLVDGVPFGRPYLRQPDRPAVKIPPRKRQRLEEITEEAAELLSRAQQLSHAQQAAVGAVNRASGEGKSVHFAQPEDTMELDEDSEEEEDDDFAPGDDVDDDGSDDSSSDSDSSSASDSSDSSDSDSDSGLGSDSDESSSDSDSDSDAAPEVRSSKTPVPKPTIPPPRPPPDMKMIPPGEGKKTTHARNVRRARTNRLKYLKEAGKLHKDADLKDLDRYEEEQRLQQNGGQPDQRQSFAQPAGKRKRLEEDGIAQSGLDEAAELAKRKQEMMAKFGQESDVTMEAAEPSSKAEEAAPITPQQQPDEAAVTEKAPERKRLRPDVSAIGRMLARQTKNLTKKPTKTKEPTPEPEGSTDPEFWKTRINLSAFECWEEEYELTAPPFPFKQHWDPIGKVMREAAKQRKAKKGGKKARPVEEQEEEEEEEEEEEKIILNYDDTPEDSPDKEIHAAIEDQLQQDIATAIQEQDDLPPVPEDLNTLPDLTPADIKVGAIIVCKFFGINPITVTPEESSYKTAIVEQEGDSGAGAGTIKLRIATRDLPKKEKKFNAKGQRIYDAKDGFFMDDDDEDGLWSGMFGELLRGKLLQPATA